MAKDIRTRIAPSPTGEDIHVGNLYTAILNYAWAKKNNGKFIVRIEDTDKVREVKGSSEKILQTLSKFKIEADESPLKGGPFAPYKQSERLNIYQDYAKKLMDNGSAYYCTCTKERLDKIREKQVAEKKAPKYDKYCLDKQEQVKKQVDQGVPFVIRLNVPNNKEFIVKDLLRGEVKFNTKDIDDQVLIKSDGYPTYHLAVVVDDTLMGINYVIRAEEWLSSTPKHILLYQALKHELPIYVHTPLLRNSDKSKLSKRKNPVWASWYLNEGILPEAMVNFLCLMGWSHPEQKEKFSFEEFLKYYDVKDIDTVGPVFDITKLEWLNGQYIKELSVDDFYNRVVQFDPKFKEHEEKKFKTILSQIQPRVRKLSEIKDLVSYFYQAPENFDEIIELANKESGLDTKGTMDHMTQVKSVLKTVDDWKAETIDKALHTLLEKSNLKPRQFFMPIRIVISGRLATPPLGDVLEILGKDESMKRIDSYLSQ